MKVHRHPVRVYYEDTDLAGIVYYANYLRFLERGRSEMVREAGISQLDMKAQGFVFAVRRVEADYLKPAHFEDELVVETRASGLKGASFDMPQRVLRGDDVLSRGAGESRRPERAGPGDTSSGGYSRKTGGDHGR
jgi:acyl-CoA thioester hydrolase